MKQPGFFDLSRRYDSLDAKADPLVALNKLIRWEDFRPDWLPRWKPPGNAPRPRAAKPRPAASLWTRS
jgi:hypothetical protein